MPKVSFPPARGPGMIVPWRLVMKRSELLIWAAALPSLAGCGPASGSDTRSSDHSVVVAGHLYSLFAASAQEGRDEIRWQAPIEALARDLNRIGPEAVFFLGDSTHDSGDDEWDFIERKFANVEADLYFLAGNHEYGDIDRFVARGGKRNEAVVVRDNKYLLLDAKTIFEPADLAFIERELADHADYRHVFVLMHYPLAAYRVPEGEVDPYRPYSGVSNWNQDVVPLLAGKVRYVFCGDLWPRVHRAVQEVGDHEIHYVLNSFGFGRGAGMEDSGAGLMPFLELRFEGDDFSIVPQAVTLDVRHPWYRYFHDLDR